MRINLNIIVIHMVEFIIKSIILFVDKLNLHYLTLVAPKFRQPK